MFLHRNIGDSDGNIWTRVLNGSVSSSGTSVDLSAFAPSTAMIALARIVNTTSSGGNWFAFGSGDDTLSTSSPYVFFGSLNPGAETVIFIDVGNTKNINLLASGASVTGLIDGMGYRVSR